jgi:hypothetical protein
MKKAFIAIILAFSLVGNITVMADNNSTNASVEGVKIPVFVDNKPIQFGNAMVVDGTTYVPVAPVFEQMGYKVNYDNKTMTVNMTKGNDSITIGVSANTISGTMEIDGEQKSISAFISNSFRDSTGVVLIPLRSIGDNLFCETVWDGNSSSAWIYSPNYQGEKREDTVKSVAVVDNKAYISAITQILNKQDLSNGVDHLELGEEVDTRLKEFNRTLNTFLQTAQKGESFEKDKKNYKGINVDYLSDEWKQLDKLQAYAVILHKQIDRLNREGLIDNADVLKVDVNEIYTKARS